MNFRVASNFARIGAVMVAAFAIAPATLSFAGEEALSAMALVVVFLAPVGFAQQAHRRALIGLLASGGGDGAGVAAVCSSQTFARASRFAIGVIALAAILAVLAAQRLEVVAGPISAAFLVAGVGRALRVLSEPGLVLLLGRRRFVAFNALVLAERSALACAVLAIGLLMPRQETAGDFLLQVFVLELILVSATQAVLARVAMRSVRSGAASGERWVDLGGRRYWTSVLDASREQGAYMLFLPLTGIAIASVDGGVYATAVMVCGQMASGIRALSAGLNEGLAALVAVGGGDGKRAGHLATARASISGLLVLGLIAAGDQVPMIWLDIVPPGYGPVSVALLLGVGVLVSAEPWIEVAVGKGFVGRIGKTTLILGLLHAVLVGGVVAALQGQQTHDWILAAYVTASVVTFGVVVPRVSALAMTANRPFRHLVPTATWIILVSVGFGVVVRSFLGTGGGGLL